MLLEYQVNRSPNRLGSITLPGFLMATLFMLPILIFTLFGAAAPELVFDRMAIENGEYWRLLTAHWVHSDLNHLVWNMAGLGVLLLLFKREHFIYLIASLIVGTLSVNLWLVWAEIDFYCGLSGVLNTVLVFALWILWNETRSQLVIWVAVGALLKVFIEISTQHAIFSNSAWPSLPESHLAGMIGGLVFLLIHKLLNRGRK